MAMYGKGHSHSHHSHEDIEVSQIAPSSTTEKSLPDEQTTPPVTDGTANEEEIMAKVQTDFMMTKADNNLTYLNENMKMVDVYVAGETKISDLKAAHVQWQVRESSK